MSGHVLACACCDRSCRSFFLPLTPAVPAPEDAALGPCQSSQPASDVNLVDSGRLPSNLTHTHTHTLTCRKTLYRQPEMPPQPLQWQSTKLGRVSVARVAVAFLNVTVSLHSRPCSANMINMKEAYSFWRFLVRKTLRHQHRFKSIV